LGALLSLLGLSIPVALLISGCVSHSIISGTTVLGPVSCEAKPKQSISGCEMCMKAFCCAEFTACANDAPCPCGMTSRLALPPPDKVLKRCGPMNASFTARESCLHANCDEESCAAASTGDHHPLVGKPAPEILAEPVAGKGARTIEQAHGKI